MGKGKGNVKLQKKRYAERYPEKERARNTRKCARRRARRKAEDPIGYAEKRRAANARYREKNPEKVRAQRARSNAIWNGKRRALLLGTGGRISSGIADRLGKIQKWRCVVCLKDLSDGYHIDHIFPLALGGRHEDSNLQLLCPSCNLSKGAKHPVDFMRSRGFLL